MKPSLHQYGAKGLPMSADLKKPSALSSSGAQLLPMSMDPITKSRSDRDSKLTEPPLYSEEKHAKERVRPPLKPAARLDGGPSNDVVLSGKRTDSFSSLTGLLPDLKPLTPRHLPPLQPPASPPPKYVSKEDSDINTSKRSPEEIQSRPRSEERQRKPKPKAPSKPPPDLRAAPSKEGTQRQAERPAKKLPNPPDVAGLGSSEFMHKTSESSAVPIQKSSENTIKASAHTQSHNPFMKHEEDLRMSQSFHGNAETVQSLALRHQVRRLKSTQSMRGHVIHQQEMTVASTTVEKTVVKKVTENESHLLELKNTSPPSKPPPMKPEITMKKTRARLQLNIEVSAIPEGAKEVDSPLSGAAEVPGPAERKFCDSPVLPQNIGRRTPSPTRGGGMGLALNISDVSDEELAMQKSYNLSASGTINIAEFQIKKSGITRSPHRDSSVEPGNIQGNIVKMFVLGKGASGVVYKALHIPTVRLVAVKNIPVFESDKRHQMVKELQALYNNIVPLTAHGVKTKSACPYVVSFYDAFINPNEGNISIVVEYMDGGSLQDIVDSGGCSNEKVLASITCRILKGLAFIHDKHQIHRDIKPGNLLIDHRGHVKLSDFGIVRDLESSIAKANTFVGTLTYMSPERIAGEPYSYTSDIWSLGLSVMACALGRFPLKTSGGYWGLLQSLREEKSFRAINFLQNFVILSNRYDEEPKRQYVGPRGGGREKRCLLAQSFNFSCLNKDKEKRPTAKELLKHPFVRQSVDSQDNDDDIWVEHEDIEMAMEELNDVISHLKSHYKEKMENTRKAGADPMRVVQELTVNLIGKLDSLASQLGLRRDLVASAIKTMIDDAVAAANARR